MPKKTPGPAPYRLFRPLTNGQTLGYRDSNYVNGVLMYNPETNEGYVVNEKAAEALAQAGFEYQRQTNGDNRNPNEFFLERLEELKAESRTELQATCDYNSTRVEATLNAIFKKA